MRWWKGRGRAALTAALALALGWWAGAGPALAAPGLWVMRDRDSAIYLFGTMHVLEAGQAWRTPLFDRAFGASATLWFETDISGTSPALLGLMRRYGRDDAHRLSDSLSPLALRRLRLRLPQLGVTLAEIEHLRPWLVAMMISSQPASTTGFTSEAGADMTLESLGRQEGKEIRSLETLEDHIRVLADLPREAELQLLEDALGAGDRYLGFDIRVGDLTSARGLEAVWAGGDLAGVGPLINNTMRVERPALYEALIRRRNLAWADILERRMRGRGVEMVNVGALHLVGPEGLPQILRQRGWKVERVQ